MLFHFNPMYCPEATRQGFGSPLTLRWFLGRLFHSVSLHKPPEMLSLGDSSWTLSMKKFFLGLLLVQSLYTLLLRRPPETPLQGKPSWTLPLEDLSSEPSLVKPLHEPLLRKSSMTLSLKGFSLEPMLDLPPISLEADHGTIPPGTKVLFGFLYMCLSSTVWEAITYLAVVTVHAEVNSVVFTFLAIYLFQSAFFFTIQPYLRGAIAAPLASGFRLMLGQEDIALGVSLRPDAIFRQNNLFVNWDNRCLDFHPRKIPCPAGGPCLPGCGGCGGTKDFYESMNQ